MKRTLLLALLASSLSALAQPKPAAAEPPKPAPFDKKLLMAFKPLPAQFEATENPLTEEKVTLGRMLYFEPRLSKNHDVSCNTCHALDKFGVDGLPFSKGHKGQLGGRNAPTVYNAGGYLAQFWDGRAATLEEQAKGPVLNPVEMAAAPDKVVKTLKSMPEYVAAFKKAFPTDKNPVTFDNAAKAIGAFERKLVTPSRFDKLLAGDDAALNDKEKQGLKAFVELGCVSCHNGPLLGGTMFQKLGLIEPYPDQSDLGRYAATKKEEDKMFFRVPTLRNISKTGPYFHNAKVQTLEEAITLMAKHQVGRLPTPEQTQNMVAFLGALTGELPTDYIKAPELPKSTAGTPKPDPK